MRINKEEAKLAGELTNKAYGWTDEELKIIVKFEGLFVAFMEGKGPKWSLAKTPLWEEMCRFESMLEARKKRGG